MKKIIIICLILLLAIFLLSERGSGPIVSQNGIATTKFVDDLMNKYDQNSDRKLSVNAESFLRIQRDNLIKVQSRGLLFTDADAFGNADGAVSSTELKNYLEEFDTDGNGELTTYKNIFHSIFKGKSEWAKFDDKYEERIKYDEL